MDWNTLKKFKKQFHLACKTAKQISQKTMNFNLIYKTEKGLCTSLNLPPEKEIAIFASCVRPLADPSGSLYFRTIASIILKNNFIKLTASDKDIIEKDIHKIEKGYIDIKYNGNSLSALEMYLIFSKGEYFEEDITAVKIYTEMKKIPSLNQFMLYQFYYYSYEVYKLCETLYNLIRQAENNIVIQPPNCKKPKNSQCIYCLTTNGNFSSEEHVYPESLGNTEIILPAGLVCDNCNNGILSYLDSCLVEHDILALLRVLYLPYNTKSGKFPKARYQNMAVEKTHPRKINFKLQSGSKKGFIVKDIKDGVHITINTLGKTPFDPLILARSLYKIALGVLCLKNGVNVALNEKYNKARNFVLGKRSFPNNLLMSCECTPSPVIEGCHIIAKPGTIFTIQIFGITFIFNLETEPVIQMNPDFEKLNFRCFSLQ
ncbi:MAG: hypothetical protein HYV59_07310 [Planctomycetes bacterium]|nr:hypothetical protein [Planctomycetota bacterium]